MRARYGYQRLILIAAFASAGGSAVHAQSFKHDSEPIATVVGRYASPERKAAGVYGTDLGWTFAHEGRLWVLFGDTWQDDVEGQRDMGVLDSGGEFAIADDALGFVSLAAFPDGHAVEAFVAAHPSASGIDWRAASPSITFARLNAVSTNLAGPLRPMHGESAMWSLPAQTPVTGFSNARQGAQSGAFAIFFQNEKLLCGNSGRTCDNGYQCKTDIGVCLEQVDQAVPSPVAQPCVLGTSRDPFCVQCAPTLPFNNGMCVDTGSSIYDESSATARASSVVRIHQVGMARKNDPLKFDSKNWITQRFFNVTSRTVSDFDKARANGAGNDYRVADGVDPQREGVFLWGRPNFGGVSKLGRDAQLYLAWVPMPVNNGSRGFNWNPEFFAGFAANGAPRFSSSERDAIPLDLDAATPGNQPEEENDLVGQTSVAWIASLNKWVMLYGGGMGTIFSELIFGDDRDLLNESKVGPIYARYADQPWGPWTKPEEFFSPGTPAAASGEYGPGGIMHSTRCTGDTCAASETAWSTDNGGLYAPDIITPWTTEENGVTSMYWHVSTWNPYQVVLMRTTFTPK